MSFRCFFDEFPIKLSVIGSSLRVRLDQNIKAGIDGTEDAQTIQLLIYTGST